MPKNIVICCDGTGNQVDSDQSNVLKLYRTLKKNARQVVYYDPGVGTLGSIDDWARVQGEVEKVLGLAFGYGLDRNVLDAYQFLVKNFRENDRICLFGFSRGAYTVRVLAGFINTVGLLREEQGNLSAYALTAYKKVSEENNFSAVRLFERTLRPRRPPIRFLGLWDTVGSVIVPRRDRLFIPSLRQLAYTARNPSVQTVRHALAVDERRRMFRPFLWNADEPYWGGPFKSAKEMRQDTLQVWFPGVHADIGGGYAESESGLAKLALQWMIDESPDDLQFIGQNINRFVLGEASSRGGDRYSKPDAVAKLHESLTPGWLPLEYLPKSNGFREWDSRKSILGMYIPNKEPRKIEDGSWLHPSVLERQAASAYDPPNLPGKYRIYEADDSPGPA